MPFRLSNRVWEVSIRSSNAMKCFFVKPRRNLADTFTVGEGPQRETQVMVARRVAEILGSCGLVPRYHDTVQWGADHSSLSFSSSPSIFLDNHRVEPFRLS
jgi:hypothetical protein